ncbi:methyl-accepting chemotaxis protein [Crassaminicella profunda]|uniref:methyl-accepting chemotaxis protein n=1 Tax=Crassaminicella profunda TaxID=1286698 RepID=UPI001CA71863|nr:methyl-accepting chemotaxis protein [Crassaminicella profunda]QZY56114.1 methyl-accepting chemotaxis protein [Crassaminicella profunda]
MKKIGLKITIGIIACCMAISILVGSVSVFESTKYIKDEANNSLLFRAQSYANDFSNNLKEVEGQVDGLSASMRAVFDIEQFKNDPNYIKEYEKSVDGIIGNFTEKTNAVTAVYFTFDPQLIGRACEIWYAKEENKDFERINSDPEGTYIEDFYPDNEEMSWFYGPIKKRTGIWSDPYVEVDLDNSTIVSYTEAVFKDNNLIGVVGIDIKIDHIKNILDKLKVYDTGYAFLLNKNYDVLVHPTFKEGEHLKNLEDESYQFIIEEMDKNQSKIIEYKFKGKDKIMSYARLSNDWVLGIAPPIDEIFKPVNNLKFMIIIFVFVGIILSIFIGLYIGKSISKPIEVLKENLEDVSNGDLRKDVNMNRKDELGDLSMSLNKAMENTKILIKGIINNSKELSISSQEIVSTTEEISAQSENASGTTQEIAAGMEESSAAIEQINASIQEMSKATSQLAQEAKEGNAISKEISNRANKMKEHAEISSEITNRMYEEKQKNIVEAIEKSKIVDEIENMSNTISQIAQQTNLLALNAAIEAARAGDAGKGFAVVAEEVRTLAEQSTKAVSNIQFVVGEVQNAFKDLSENAGGLLKFINEKIQPDYKDLLKAGDQYMEDAKTFSNLVQDFSASTEDIVSFMGGVSMAVESVASSIEQGASGSQDIVTGIVEVAQAIEEVVKTTENQATLAQQLDEMVQKFKV